MFLKNVTVISALLLLGACASTSVSHVDTEISAVIDVPGASKDEIYISTKTWIAENFKSAKSVIEVDSREDGIVIGKGSIKYPCSSTLSCFGKEEWQVPFTMRVDMKEGKYKITFMNLKIALPPSNYLGVYSSGSEVAVKDQSDFDRIKPALLSLGAGVSKAVESNSSNSNW